MDMQGGRAPADARDPHAYSGGYTLDRGDYTLPGVRRLRLGDEHPYGGMMFDRLEVVDTENDALYIFDAQAWYGFNYDRAVLKLEGDYSDGRFDEVSTEVLWGHAISTFWDTQLGVRYDTGESPDRGWIALGVQGLAPYWFEVDATAYLGKSGRTAFEFEAEYDLLLTQQIILQPRVEFSLYGKSDKEHGLGSGLTDGSLGLRMRYELTRQFAPYLGGEWTAKFGDTKSMAEEAGEKADEISWLAGIRFWF
jgi:copper resistance protein B